MTFPSLNQVFWPSWAHFLENPRRYLWNMLILKKISDARTSTAAINSLQRNDAPTRKNKVAGTKTKSLFRVMWSANHMTASIHRAHDRNLGYLTQLPGGSSYGRRVTRYSSRKRTCANNEIIAFHGRNAHWASICKFTFGKRSRAFGFLLNNCCRWRRSWHIDGEKKASSVKSWNLKLY